MSAPYAHPEPRSMDPSHTTPSWQRLGPAATIALLLTVVVHLLTGDVGLGLADEGFLWYGIQRVLEGEVPLRDFQSYEPGRYYWGAAWGLWRGDGVLAMREAIALFQWVGLTCGLLVCTRVARHPLALTFAGLVLLAWMFPRNKVFESSIAMMAVHAAVRLLEHRSVRRHFQAGAFCGLMGCMGRNHGLYIACGFLLLMAFTWFRLGEGRRLRKFGAWSAGVVVGFSPVLAMMLFVPGFAAALVENVLFFAEHGANLSKPWPWPWDFRYEHLPTLQRAALAGAFLLPVVLYPLGLIVALRTRPENLAPRTVLLAGVFMGVFYLHHVVELSAPRHLAQCVHPGLLAMLGLPFALRGGRRLGWPAALLGLGLGTMMIVAGASTHPLLKTRKLREGGPLVEIDAAGDRLWVDEETAEFVSLVTRVVERHVPPGEPIFMAPSYSTLYPLLGRRSPVWRIYFLWAADEAEQEELIEALEGLDWALIIDEPPIKRREDLKFNATHDRVWAYLNREFRTVGRREFLPPRYLFKRVTEGS